MTAPLCVEQSLPTHRSRRQVSQRTTGPPWNLTFAEGVEPSEAGGCSRSRVPIDDRDRSAGERLHLKVANGRCPTRTWPARSSARCPEADRQASGGL